MSRKMQHLFLATTIKSYGTHNYVLYFNSQRLMTSVVKYAQIGINILAVHLKIINKAKLHF